MPGGAASRVGFAADGGALSGSSHEEAAAANGWPSEEDTNGAGGAGAGEGREYRGGASATATVPCCGRVGSAAASGALSGSSHDEAAANGWPSDEDANGTGGVAAGKG